MDPFGLGSTILCRGRASPRTPAPRWPGSRGRPRPGCTLGRRMLSSGSLHQKFGNRNINKYKTNRNLDQDTAFCQHLLWAQTRSRALQKSVYSSMCESPPLKNRTHTHAQKKKEPLQEPSKKPLKREPEKDTKCPSASGLVALETGVYTGFKGSRCYPVPTCRVSWGTDG